jgi:hypothetical protein
MMVLFGHEKAGAQDPKTPPPPPPPQPPVYSPPVTTFSSNTKTNNPTQSVSEAQDTRGDFLKQLREKQKRMGLISEDIPEENPKKDKNQKPPIAPKPQFNATRNIQAQSNQGTSSVVHATGVPPPPPPPPPPHSKPIGVPVRGAPSNKKIDSEKSAHKISTDELKKKIEESQARRNKK